MYNVHVLVHCKYSDTKGHSCLPNVHNLSVLFEYKSIASLLSYSIIMY